MNALAHLTATEIAARVRAGELTALEVAEAVIARHQKRNEDVHAFSYFEPELLRAQAGALDAMADRGPLHGVPIAVKDVINTKDMPTEHNTTRYRGSRPGVDASCVDTLRSAGALLVGKTVTTEFAATGVGGATRNPHDLSRTPGGSSSGSAAAVADFQAAIGLGTQTGGSTIRPASFTGIFGWKPTWNSVSREGLKMFSATCDTLGLYARSAADLALLADVFAFEPVADEPTALDGLRVAVCRSPVWPKALPATRRALEDGSAALREAGATVDELELPALFDGLSDAHGVILKREGRSAFLGEARATPGLDDHFRTMVDNRDDLSADLCRKAYQLADRCRAVLDELQQDVDVLLTPSATGEAPVGIATTGDASFNGLWTVLQVPVVNVPGHVGPAGLPVGLSLVGRRYEDRKTIAVAGLVGAVWSAADAGGRSVA